MASNETPILIVGAGPVGLTAALVLSHLDTPFRIIDKSQSPTDISKALVLWRRSLQCLDSYLPIENIVDGHNVAAGLRLYSGGKPMADISFAEEGRGDPPAVFIPQYDTEKILIDGIEASGATVERGVELTGYEAHDDGVSVTLQHEGGSETHQVSWLIGCDGGHSMVRKHLGISFPGETMNRRWLLADIGIEESMPMDELRIDTAPQGAVACFPISARRWRVICDAGPIEEGAEPQPVTLEQIQKIMRERTSWGWTLREAFWLTEFHVNERQVEQYRHGRVFLAGDAAHVHSPAGGQGMNTGIQDAINLAWKLAMVQGGQAPEALLDTYQAERHPIGAMVVKGSAMLIKNATQTSRVARGVRSFLIPLAASIGPVRRKLMGMLTEDNVTYRDGPLAGIRKSHVSHGPGDGFPDRIISIDGQEMSSTQLLRNAGPTIVVFGDDQDLSDVSFGFDGKGMPIVKKQIGPEGDAQDPEGALARTLGLHDGGLVLVRPDGVIAAVAQQASELRIWCHDRLLRKVMAP